MSDKRLPVDLALGKAKTLARKGALDQAMSLYRDVLERFPGNKRAAEGLKAIIRPKQDRKPGVPVAQPPKEQIDGLIALYRKGLLHAALAQGTVLAGQYPEALNIRNILGAVNAGLGRLDQAAAIYAQILQVKPDYAKGYNNLGNILFELGKHAEAIANYTKALRIKPDYAEAQNNLGCALDDLGKHEEAIASYAEALRIKPDYAEAHDNLGSALKAIGRHEEAIASYNEALRIKPNYAEGHSNLGIALKAIGRHEEAITCFTEALRIKPNLAEAHINMGTIKTYRTGDPQIARMLELIANPSTTENDKMHLSFALGKAYDDIDDAENSFRYLLRGNRLRKKELGYDIDSDRRLFSLITSIFEANDLPALEAARSGSERQTRPIFIVGMPRTGTTLVEQILASHSQVYGAGELEFLSSVVKPVLDGIAQSDNVDLTTPSLKAVRDGYFSRLDGLSADAACVTDKMPLNFLSVGFILTAMPEARVICVQRDPVATCWSIFKHNFSTKGNGYACDQVDIAEYYKMHADLMDFWRNKFPNQIYGLTYETLTENPETETRKLLEYCGLAWEEQCLEFHKTKRAVMTASSLQVRQRMYQGSSEAWRKYEAYIGPLRQALER